MSTTSVFSRAMEEPDVKGTVRDDGNKKRKKKLRVTWHRWLNLTNA